MNDWDYAARDAVLHDVQRERDAQHAKWGEQNWPDGTGSDFQKGGAEWAKRRTDEAAVDGSLTYEHILTEEFFEALAESDKSKLRTELIQVAAVAVAWVEKLDREGA